MSIKIVKLKRREGSSMEKRWFIGACVVSALVIFGITVLTGSKQTMVEPIVSTSNIFVPATVINSKLKMASTKVVKHFNVNEDSVVYLNSEVNKASMDSVISQIKGKLLHKKPVYLLIDSPGGSVLEGARLVALLEHTKTPVYTVCTGICASMAFIIHQYGTKRYAVDKAILMAHPASGQAMGQVENMLSLLHMLQGYIDKMDAYIANRSNMKLDEFKSAFSYELWLDAEDAQKRNLVDEIVVFDSNLSAPASQEVPPSDNTNHTKFNIVL